MKITVNYTTQLKAAIGTGREEIEIADDSRLSDLLKLLSDQHPEPFSSLVLDDAGRLLPSILIAIGDEQVQPDNDPELSSTSITFLSAISGG